MPGFAVRSRIDSANILAWRAGNWHLPRSLAHTLCGNISEMNRSTDLRSERGSKAPKAAKLTRARRTAILKALADPRRFKLLEHIAKARCPLGCSEARSALAISAATLSHHIKELEAAGLIVAAREGKFVKLSLCPEVLNRLLDSLASMAAASSPSLPPAPRK